MERLYTIALFAGVLLAFFAGCAMHPAYVSCKGKGSMTNTVNAMGVYGGAANTTVDCSGEGFVYEQRSYAPKDKPKP